MKNYLITGTAGTGKSAVGEALCLKGYRVIEFDGYPRNGVIYKDYRQKFDRRTDKPTKYQRGDGWSVLRHIDWRIDRSKLIPDLKGNADEVQFVCGYANNWEELKEDFDGIFLLDVDPTIIANRLLTRTTGDWGRSYLEEMRHATETDAEYKKVY